ncbi:hypothetical protein [Hymenobacter negativus]|uniref:Lipoprotein n=1 Tax=Hymenobacter negativus TaxID=2795026 RepID=A0ABS0Q7K6_9BACT|nr:MULTISPECIES: hypothetical protein [Bacteria]MBH8558623.1 hypothetical protein [Hymenobacter negativus]MBH8570161.1 hypothetical protein [Hymenobacter negativus]MBR7209901.1 hypothetical protein [Microvirga sp. STS02]
MKLTSTLLLAVSAATLALTSCSSEPSDWRPDEKVSLDQVAPGTRDDENFDHSVPNGSIENVNSPLMKAAAGQAPETEAKHPAAESAISANAEEGMRKRGQLHDAGKSGQADTAENGHQIQR